MIDAVAYELGLPHSWKAHNIIHVSLLKPNLSNGEMVDPHFFHNGGMQE